jgi:hypothetical protein
MRFVPVKTEEQQANAILFRARDLLVRQRTQCINALRGHLLEYGYVFPQGSTHVATLIAQVEDPGSALPESARVVLKLLIDTLTALEGQISRWRDQPALESRPDGTPIDDNPWCGTDRLDSNYRPGSGGAELPRRASLRGLVRAHPDGEINRRQAKNRRCL